MDYLFSVAAFFLAAFFAGAGALTAAAFAGRPLPPQVVSGA